MVFVTDTQAFKEVEVQYQEWEKRIMQKTTEVVKGLRKTLTKQVADEVYKAIQDDIDADMYSNFLNFANDLWGESLKYVVGEITYPTKYDGSFAKYAQSLGWQPEDIRKKVYQDNKEEFTKAITCDYLYDKLAYFFLQSPYWKEIDLKLDGPHTQYRIMKAFMERLASDSKFDNLLEGLVDERIMSKKAQLRNIENQIKNMSSNLNALIGED